MKHKLNHIENSITIYYDSRTGNVKRFIESVSKRMPINAININDQEYFENIPGHLITYTTGSAQIPVTTSYFLERHSNLIISVSASGNRNWGSNFAKSADKISELYKLPVLLKFELSGFPSDVENFIGNITKSIYTI